MKIYFKELEYFIKKWYFSAFLFLLSLIGFGFTISHISVNIDSLPGEIYHGSGNMMLSSGRFGMTFWTKLFCNGLYLVEDSYAIGIIGVAMLVLSAINFCILFRRASNDTISMPAYMVFAGAFISYPLINEIWEYIGMELIICGGYLFVSFAILFIYDQIEAKKINVLKCVAILFMLTILCSSYESLMCVYVFVVLTVLFLRERQENNWKKHLVEGCIYAGGLVCGLISRFIVHRIIVAVMNIDIGVNGATEIMWFVERSPITTIKRLLKEIVLNHILASPLYFPLFVFILCAIIFGIFVIYNLCKKRIFASILMFGILCSTELLSVIQGVAAPYRTCQTFALLIGFTLMLIANKLRWKQAIPLLLCFLCLTQSIYLNYIFTLNQLRYEEEAYVVREIGTDLIAEHDTSKPIMFIGYYTFSDRINRQITIAPDTAKFKIAQKIEQLTNREGALVYREFPHTNINSVINWSEYAFGGSDMMRLLFEYHGYKINVTNDYWKDYEQCIKYDSENNIPNYPNKGYIVELDNIIIVKLGQIG